LKAERFANPNDQAADARSRGFAQRTQRPQRRRAAEGKESERRGGDRRQLKEENLNRQSMFQSNQQASGCPKR
jgi:hypothetical protein